MDIQQQNYLFVNAMQRWFLFFIKSIVTHFIKSIINECEVAISFLFADGQ